MSQLAGEPLWFPTVGAPVEWTQLLTELVDTFDLTLDRTGSTLGYGYWLEQVAAGTTPLSFIGAAMQLPPDVHLSIVPLTTPTPVFLWWAMWRRRVPAGLIDDVLNAVRYSLRASDTPRLAETWVPEQDRPFIRSGP